MSRRRIDGKVKQHVAKGLGMPASQRFDFKVTTDAGKEYRCERMVTGTHELRQTIVVHGVGCEDDPADYGRRGRPTVTMASIARAIAFGIIRGGGRRSA